MPQNLRDVRERVGRNVQRLRRERGLTQERLAESAGNSGKHIGQIERGEVNVGLDVLSGIAAALSVDVADLFWSPPRRRRAQSPLFLAHEASLKDIERAVRRIRTARLARSADVE